MLVEIGHDANYVRQLSAGVERRTALVVDQHEREVIRARIDRQPDDEAAQQLALAGTSCAGKEGMRAIADEIDVDHTLVGHADHRANGGRTRRPASGRDGRRLRRPSRVKAGRRPSGSRRITQWILRIDRVRPASRPALSRFAR